MSVFIYPVFQAVHLERNTRGDVELHVRFNVASVQVRNRHEVITLYVVMDKELVAVARIVIFIATTRRVPMRWWIISLCARDRAEYKCNQRPNEHFRESQDVVGVRRKKDSVQFRMCWPTVSRFKRNSTVAAYLT